MVVIGMANKGLLDEFKLSLLSVITLLQYQSRIE